MAITSSVVYSKETLNRLATELTEVCSKINLNRKAWNKVMMHSTSQLREFKHLVLRISGRVGIRIGIDRLSEKSREYEKDQRADDEIFHPNPAINALIGYEEQNEK